MKRFRRKLTGRDSANALNGSGGKASDTTTSGHEPVGYETPPLMHRWAVQVGQALGRNGAPASRVRAGSPASRLLAAWSDLRQALVKGAANKQATEHFATIASAPHRVEHDLNVIPDREAKLERLHEDKIVPAEEHVEVRQSLLAKLEERYEALHPLQRLGIVALLMTGFINVGVGVFDAAVLHQVMQFTPGGDFVHWFVTISVPLVVISVNHSVGVLLAGVLREMDPGQYGRRLLVAALFVLAGLALFALTLAYFRGLAYDASNDQIAALARGDDVALTPLISPWWIAPLQIVGSAAAIAVSALWAFGVDGRTLSQQIGTAKHELAQAKADREALRVQAESLLDAIQALKRAPEREQQRCAEAEVRLRAIAIEAGDELEAERALHDAIQSQLESSRELAVCGVEERERRTASTSVAIVLVVGLLTAILGTISGVAVLLVGGLVAVACAAAVAWLSRSTRKRRRYEQPVWKVRHGRPPFATDASESHNGNGNGAVAIPKE